MKRSHDEHNICREGDPSSENWPETSRSCFCPFGVIASFGFAEAPHARVRFGHHRLAGLLRERGEGEVVATQQLFRNGDAEVGAARAPRLQLEAVEARQIALADPSASAAGVGSGPVRASATERSSYKTVAVEDAAAVRSSRSSATGLSDAAPAIRRHVRRRSASTLCAATAPVNLSY